MTDTGFPSERTAICAQLLHHNGRALHFLQLAAREIDTPATRSLLARLRDEATTDAEAAVEQILHRLDALVQAVHYGQAELRRELENAQGGEAARGRDHLPGALGRFISERESQPGFSWEARQDPVRGWVVSWKQLTSSGTVRGAGHLSEKPYAWLEG